MQLLAWNDALKTHIDVIDQQHRGLVDTVNATAARLDADAALGIDETRALLGYLKDYAEVHFGTEEALMALFDLAPDYMERHHRNHARFLAHVGEMLEEVGEDGMPDGRQVLAFLGDWLIRHIQGEDQGLARRLHAARLAEFPALAATRPTPGQAGGAEPALPFVEALAGGSATLHASEAGVLALVAGSAQGALVIALDGALMPATVVQANAAAAARLGRSPEALKDCPVASLFGAAETRRFPVLMSEVLVSGHFEGALEWVGPEAVVTRAQVRVTPLFVHGQMAILVVFGVSAGVRRPYAAHPADARSAAPAGAPALGPGGTVLSRHPLFAKLTRSELAGVESTSRLLRLGKGQVVFHKGDDPAGLYMVISGQVSLTVSNSRGVEKVLGIVDAQQVFGEVEVFSGSRCLMSAQSLGPTVVLMIPAATVRTLQASSLGFAGGAAAYLGRRLHEVIGDVEALTLHTAMERIIDHLLEHAGINSHGVLEAMLPAQKQIIASWLNLTPPTLSRAFQQLSEAGLINVTRRYVTIPDREALVRYRARDAAG